MAKKKKYKMGDALREKMAEQDQRIYRETFDNMECTNPTCPVKFHDCIPIQANCHPESPVFVAYLREYGALSIICATCKKPIILVAVGIKGITLSA